MKRLNFLVLSMLILSAARAVAETNAAAQATGRDPFWPVGYAPAAPSSEVSPTPAAAPQTQAPVEKPKAGLQIDNLSEEQQAAIRSKLKVSGIMRFGPDYVARINGQLAGTGDELPVELEGQRLVFLVRSVTKDAVQLEPKR